MSAPTDPLAQLVDIAAEQLRWQRAAVLPQVRGTLNSTLTTTQLRSAYELCDGDVTGKQVADRVNTTPQSVSNWTRRWRDAGLAFVNSAGRVQHLVSLEAVGLPIDLGDDSMKGKKAKPKST